MPIIRFRGRVIPYAYKLHAGPLTLLWPEPDKSGHMRFDVKITDSIVEVGCHIPKYDPDDSIELPHVRALELARATVDCLAFVDGIGATLIFEEFISPAGVVLQLLAHNKALPKLCTAFSKDANATPGSTLDSMLRLVIREPALFLALNDLITAVTIPGQVAVNCGRAIEGLRAILVPNDPKRKEGWAALQDSLNITRSYREFITTTSTGPRHGDRTDIPRDTSQEVIERSWVIMNRFLEYRKRGNVPLPISEFPLLSYQSSTGWLL
jgi:hypothetical protein